MERRKMDSVWNERKIMSKQTYKFEILKKDKSAKNFYMKTVNKFTYKIYCAIFSA